MKSFGRLVSCLLWKQAPCKNQSHASGSSSSSGSSSGGRSVAGSGGVSAATGSSSVVTSSAAAVAASSPPSPTYVSTRARNCASDEAVKQTLVVELNQSEGEELGLVVTGGIDKDSPPRVAYMKPNGVAYRSDLLEVGDLLMSVNGVDVTLMKHFEIVNMLQNSSIQRTVLELHYTLPDPHQLSFSVVCRRIEVRLSREAEGEAFGLTLRGGANGSDPRKSRPLIVTQIRPGSPADREGTLKVGDRVLAVNRVNVAQRSLPEVLRLLRELREAVFLVEYDVSVLEVVQNATGPLLVEIDKLPGYSLGVTLTRALYHGKSVFVVDRIAPASIADRCGALHVGDHLLSIDGVCLDDVTVAAANGMLNANAGTQLQLEVVPGPLVRAGTVGPAAPDSLKCTTVHGNPSAGGDRMFPSASLNSVSSVQSRATINSMKTQVGSALSSSFFFGASRDRTPHHGGGGGGGGGGWDSSLTRGQTASAGNTLLSSSSGLSQVCHVDTTEVMLVYDQRGSFGLVVDPVPGRPVASNGMLMEPPIIRHVEHKGPAERCGVLQEGDRVLAINGQYLEGRTMVEVQELMKESGVKMLLLVEFNVAESIIPSSGVFVVKLAKRNAGLGITISCPRNRRPGQHLVISNVKKGSVAHRTGSIQPGDKLLAINNVRLDNCTLEDSARVLQDTQDIVKLTIKKDENFADEPDPTHLITYTVELPKFAGPIGITISGSEEPFDPIFISSLTEEGLAEKTGALHVGDRLLAINGVSLRGRTLSDAIQLLQNAGQTVTLKITRPTNRGRRTSSEPSGKHGSMDSALESWDSSGLEAIHKSFSLKEPQTSKGGSSENSDRKVNNRIGEESGETAMKSKKVDPREEEETGGGVGWDFVTVTSPSASVPPSCCSSGGGDEWSRQVDDLDHLNAAATAGVPGLDSFSDLPDITEADAAFDCHRHSAAIDAGYFTVDEADSKRLYPPSKAEEEDDGPDTVAAPGGGGGLPGVDAAAADDSSVVAAADVHLKEVEEQLQNIFTPTPIELTKVTLWKRSDSDDFGFSLSDGVFEKGVYVGAVRPRGPAAEALRPYDRLLQVNSVRTKDLDCCQVVPVIARSGNRVDLVISRNPLLTRSPSEEEEGVDDTASAPATLPRREDHGWGGGGGAGAVAGARQGSASSSSAAAAAAAWQTRRTTTVPRNSKPRRVAFRMDPSSTA